MPATVTSPAWTPPVQTHPYSKPLHAASKQGSKPVTTTSGQPTMSYDELWGMIETNMGQRLTQVSLGDR
jgi:hypothetical protein